LDERALMAGALIVVGTPIGNLDDLSPRAARALSEADVIACEDTRVTRKLLTRAPSRARLVAYHAHNEAVQTVKLTRAVASGSRVALVTDAGMPGLSDPGHRLIAACVDAGLRVDVVPGPSAALAALVVSGLPTARFSFEGFLPRTGAARRRRLEAIAREERTAVVFEAPHRLEEMLEAALETLGDRRAVLARELTKMHEEILRGTLSELLEAVRENGVRGEVTLVIEGASQEAATADEATLIGRVRELMREGVPKKEAVARAAVEARVPKRTVYQAAVDAGL
jgi:16S rRNA (cytidine1402-2'-O)-methyltransferase